MAGWNVMEWTRSKGQYYPYDPADGRERLSGTSARVVRGAAFVPDRKDVQSASRYYDVPNSRQHYLGFRVVVSPFGSDL